MSRIWTSWNSINEIVWDYKVLQCVRWAGQKLGIKTCSGPWFHDPTCLLFCWFCFLFLHCLGSLAGIFFDKA